MELTTCLQHNLVSHPEGRGSAVFRMSAEVPQWYCARTKPKHEHIAAANVRQQLQLEVFNPRLRVQHVTPRGRVRQMESLFPCYIFIRCPTDETLSEIQYVNGVSSLVRFGQKIPAVAEAVIQELQSHFDAEATLTLEDRLAPADAVRVASGAFAGMPATVLRVMPATRRVQILLEVLGRATPVEVDRAAVVLEKNTVADWAPMLAVAPR